MILMALPLDTSSYDYKYLKNLNEDVKLKSDIYGSWDLDMDNDDYINVTGNNSLLNACIIAIMTRFKELKTISTYDGFGCRVHELIKDNQTKIFLYKLETSINEVLSNMRRIRTVNWINISKTGVHEYTVSFSITSVNDEIIKGELSL